MSTKSGGDNDPINEEYTGNVTEVGTQAVWSLSSCKPGKFICFNWLYGIGIYGELEYHCLAYHFY